LCGWCVGTRNAPEKNGLADFSAGPFCLSARFFAPERAAQSSGLFLA
jgi:hypothetical protein